MKAARLSVHCPSPSQATFQDTVVGPFYFLLFFAIFVMLIASQLFWIRRVLDLGERFIPGKPRRAWLAVIAGLIYLIIFTYSFPGIESTSAHIFRAADY